METLSKETIIDTWRITYSNENEVKYNGKLTVTDKHLLYDAQLDANSKKLIAAALFIKWGSEYYIVIPKEHIKKVDVQKNIFAKKAIITLDDNTKHSFNCGMLNIDSIVKAIKKNKTKNKL